MNSLFSSCRSYRENFPAMDELPPPDRAAVQRHLEKCAGCRSYYAEVQTLVRPLLNWEANFAAPEPSRTAQSRWNKDFAEVRQPGRPRWTDLAHGFLAWCRDMIKPYRWAWAGLATAWVAIIAISISSREPSPSLASGLPPEMLRAFLASEGLLARSTAPDSPGPATGVTKSAPSPRL